MTAIGLSGKMVFSPEPSMLQQVGDKVVTHGDTNGGQGWLQTPKPGRKLSPAWGTLHKFSLGILSHSPLLTSSDTFPSMMLMAMLLS